MAYANHVDAHDAAAVTEAVAEKLMSGFGADLAGFAADVSDHVARLLGQRRPHRSG